MKMKKLIEILVTAAILSFGSASSFAVAVTIENENDTHEGNLLFDIGASSIIDNGLMNTINVGLNAFEAKTAAQGDPVHAFDTFSMDIVAPDGYVITGIQYFEELSWTVQNGFVFGSGSLEVENVVTALGKSIRIIEGGSDSGSPSFTSGLILFDNLASVDVAVTNSLLSGVTDFADLNAIAEISKTSAYFEVTLAAAPVPLPPALWMLGSAILGLVAVRRKNNA